MRPFARCLARGVLPLTALAAASASAQTLGGRVVDRATRKPLQIEVHLVADTAVVARTTSSAAGEFYVDAPRPALYRVEFVVDSTTTVLSDTLRLAGEFVEREFLIEVRSDESAPAEQIYDELQVEKQVAPRPGNRGPRYPAELRDAKIEGEVLVQFIVDIQGHPRPETFKVLRSTHAGFTMAVREALPGMTFFPAEVHGRKVPQLVRMPFVFSLGRR